MRARPYGLGFAFLGPSLVLLILFFFAPVLLTGVFAFTNMSTATGIGSGYYTVTPSLLRDLKAEGVGQAADELSQGAFVVSPETLEAARAAGVDGRFVDEIASKLQGRSFENSSEFQRALKDLDSRPRAIRALKLAMDPFTASVLNVRYDTRDAAFSAISAAAPSLDADAVNTVVNRAYTGWVFTPSNFAALVSKPDTWRVVANTIAYVGATLAFNVLVGLFLAIATFYLPRSSASFFNALWLLPRITPVVLYAIMWKWFTWDTGFIAVIARDLGLPSFNYMKGSVASAWTIVILLNGFIGASFGMILFSGSLRAIPMQQLWASEVDGANRWQQITCIILPQMRWPILFVTSYQTLSLLSSYETIWLTTNGGPGNTTTVWALEAFRTALSNYTGNLQYGLGSAMALILVAVGLVLSIAYLFLFKFDDLISSPKIEF